MRLIETILERSTCVVNSYGAAKVSLASGECGVIQCCHFVRILYILQTLNLAVLPPTVENIISIWSVRILYPTGKGIHTIYF